MKDDIALERSRSDGQQELWAGQIDDARRAARETQETAEQRESSLQRAMTKQEQKINSLCDELRQQEQTVGEFVSALAALRDRELTSVTAELDKSDERVETLESHQREMISSNERLSLALNQADRETREAQSESSRLQTLANERQRALDDMHKGL